MDEPTKIGVVGCGFFSGNHLHSWKHLEDQGAKLVAVCDLDETKARAAAETHGVANWYPSAQAMVREADLDLVDIVTQVDTHKDLAQFTIENGLGTIVQKPFGRDLDECIAMTEMAEKAGVFLAVHENFRFQNPNLIVADKIRSGAIGTPGWARISFRTGYDIYAGQPYLLSEERFIVSDVGVHVADLARFFLGEADRVSAELQRRNPDVQGEDTATLLLHHVSGAVSVVECTYGCRRLPDIFPETLIEIEGSEGAIKVSSGPVIEVTSNGAVEIIDADVGLMDWTERPWHVVQDSAMRTCEHILARFRAGKAADVSGADNVRTFALCEAAYDSAASGTSVRPRA